MPQSVRGLVVELVREVLVSMSFLIGSWVAQLAGIHLFVQTLIAHIVKGYQNVHTS